MPEIWYHLKIIKAHLLAASVSAPSVWPHPNAISILKCRRHCITEGSKKKSMYKKKELFLLFYFLLLFHFFFFSPIFVRNAALYSKFIKAALLFWGLCMPGIPLCQGTEQLNRHCPDSNQSPSPSPGTGRGTSTGPGSGSGSGRGPNALRWQ